MHISIDNAPPLVASILNFPIITPAGPHQLASSFSFVQALNTFQGLACRIRVIRTSSKNYFFHCL